MTSLTSRLPPLSAPAWWFVSLLEMPSLAAFR